VKVEIKDREAFASLNPAHVAAYLNNNGWKSPKTSGVIACLAVVQHSNGQGRVEVC